MTKKLLDKTSKAYIIFSLLLLLVSAPIFYFLTQKLYIEDADEALILHKNEFLKNRYHHLKEEDIPTMNKYSRDIKIKKGEMSNKNELFHNNYYDTLYSENEPYRELNYPIKVEGKPYIFSSRINLLETADLIKNISLLFFAITALMLLGLYVISKRLSFTLWKPFNKTLEQIEKFEIDKSPQPKFEETDIEEFNRLNSSIEKLIRKNTLIYQSQREFIDNAAHELQTPLAVFQAQIEVLMQREDITQGQSEIIGTLSTTLSRLNKLNKNLLLLSKMERNQFVSTENVSINTIFEKQSDFFIEQAEAKQISVNIDLKEECIVKSNPILVEILVSNLFLNAIQHNVSKGKISISLDKNTLIFANTGTNQALASEKLFQRFTKTNPSSQGNGLGLSIIHKIAMINHWQLEYKFINQEHFFVVIF